MKISAQNREDIRKYYLGTHIKCTETGDRIWYVKDVTKEYVLLRDVENTEVCIDLSEEYTIDYVIPARCVFQRGQEAYALIRIPAQQYQRGIAGKNTAFCRLDEGGRWRSLELRLDILQDFVDKPTYLTSADLKDHRSIALSPRFAVDISGKVFAFTTKIGQLVQNNKAMYCDKYFTREMREFFPGVTIL